MGSSVRLKGITKTFGAVTALDSVDLEVREGSIHALVGENGAGKTTLMRVLYGAVSPDRGMIEVGGQAVQLGSSADAIRVGIGMVSQHYGIIPGLTCLQNLMLGAEPSAWLDLPACRARAEELAQRMGFRFNWDDDAESLSPASAQKLEILKLLWKEARIMILDEPTAMLSPVDGDALFGSLRKLADEGHTVILVTHRLPEVFNHCERVTVLRGGRRIAEFEVAETTPSELARQIVGGELAPPAPLAEIERKEALLSVRGLSVKGERGDVSLDEVSFDVYPGEIVGLAGVDGSGQRELIQAMAGLIPASGTIALDGAELSSGNAMERIGKGLRVLPEDRVHEAIIAEWSLELNAALGLQEQPPLRRGALVDKGARRDLAERIAARFSTKHGGLSFPVESLSGGNQQRFVAARTLALSPKLIVAFQPARGLDIHGTRHVFEGLREECRRGAGALIVSFDLDELLAYCDRILTLYSGRLTAPPTGFERDRDTIGKLMVGAA